MATPAELYVEGVKKKLKNYFCAWLPNHTLKLGDVGILNGKFFTQVTTLDKLGIPFEVREDDSPTPMDFTSDSGVSFSFKLGGETNAELTSIPQAKAGIGISFGKQGSFVVKAEKTYEPSIEDSASLQKAILSAAKNKTWDRRWAVIYRIVNAPTATIIISNSAESNIELAANSSVSAAELDIGNANLELGIRKKTGDVFHMINAENVSPFFRLARIKKKFPFGKSHVGYQSPSDLLNPVDALTPEDIEKTNIFDELYLDAITDSEIGM